VHGACLVANLLLGEIRDSAANCAYKDHDGSRKNLNVTIKREMTGIGFRGPAVPVVPTRGRELFSRAQTSLDLRRVTSFDFLGKAP
jgi:hypothetical protein